MALSLSYDDQLSRVRLTAGGLSDTVPVTVEKSLDQVRWSTVRGGSSVTPSGGSVALDDYEFGAGVPNFYRLSVPPVQVLPMSGQVVTGGAGVAATMDATGMSINLTGRMLRLTLTVSDVTKIGNLSLFVATSAGLANNIRWRFNAMTSSSRLGKSGEMFQVALQLAEINSVAGTVTLSPTGVPSQTSGFTTVRLHVVDTATGPITVTLHKIEVVPAPPGAFVSITFDDSHSSITSQAFAKMQALNFRGTDYTIVSHLGQADKSTLADLQTRAAAGWEIGGHAYDGAVHDARLTGVTQAVARADLVALHDWLASNFPDAQGRYSQAYPGGQYETTTDGAAIEGLVRAAGFHSGRTILADVGVSTHVQIASPRDPMPHRLHAMSGISSLSAGQFNPTALTATGGVLDKVANNGGWLILCFHRITAGAPSATTEISKANFDAIMDAIAARGMTVLPVREVIETIGTITPTIDQVWLKSIARPFLNREVVVREVTDITRPSRSGVFDVVGRSYPISITDVRGACRWTLQINTYSAAETDALDLMLASGDTLFIQAPPTGRCAVVPTAYVVAGDVRQSIPDTAELEWQVFTVPVAEVAAPGADVVGATITWQGVINTYATWADVITANLMWGDLLDQIGDPSDVIVP